MSKSCEQKESVLFSKQKAPSVQIFLFTVSILMQMAKEIGNCIALLNSSLRYCFYQFVIAGYCSGTLRMQGFTPLPSLANLDVECLYPAHGIRDTVHPVGMVALGPPLHTVSPNLG